MTTREPKKRRRDRGDGTIAWDKANKCYVGRISLGYNRDGTRNRPTVWGKTKTEVREKLDKLREEVNAGVRTPATYTVELCVKDWWLRRLHLGPVWRLAVAPPHGRLAP